jgi:PiT family inorganic phosphate transporter
VDENSLPVFILALGLGYVYAFVSGFTDAANSIATSVGSRALSPLIAVLMAAFLALVGGLTGTAVAETIGRGIVDPQAITLATVAAGLLGAMSWSLFTYFFGIPVSETHGLIGGLTGAALATAGFDVVVLSGLQKVLIAIVASPLLGFLGGYLFILTIYWVFHRAARNIMVPIFTNLQRLSAVFMAFSHGRNDAQKPMGVIALALALYSGQDLTVHLWIIVSSAALLGVGIAYGGWRIIRTLGMKITNLDTTHGFAAETSGALVLQGASILGIPVSTTHTITSSIVGAGAVRRISAVAWGVTRDIGMSWLLTLPVTIALGAVYLIVIRSLLGVFT